MVVIPSQGRCLHHRPHLALLGGRDLDGLVLEGLVGAPGDGGVARDGLAGCLGELSQQRFLGVGRSRLSQSEINGLKAPYFQGVEKTSARLTRGFNPMRSTCTALALVLSENTPFCLSRIIFQLGEKQETTVRAARGLRYSVYAFGVCVHFGTSATVCGSRWAVVPVDGAKRLGWFRSIRSGARSSPSRNETSAVCAICRKGSRQRTFVYARLRRLDKDGDLLKVD